MKKARRWNSYHCHLCIAYELLGSSLHDQLEKGAFTVEKIRLISRQICSALNFLHSHDITHSDLKPENVCFVHRIKSRRRLPTKVKLIDFGNSYFKEDRHVGTVGTMNYRSIESIIGIPWSHPVDAWAVGCIVFELYHMMERTLGQIPPRIGKYIMYKVYFQVKIFFDYEFYELKEKRQRRFSDFFFDLNFFGNWEFVNRVKKINGQSM